MIITIDCRMIFSSGIGRYLRDILSFLPQCGLFEKIYILIYENDLEKLEVKNKLIPILVTSKTFSISEQFELPLKIPKCDFFWSPQYNIPILPIKANMRVSTIHDVFQLAHFRQLSLLKKIYVKLMVNLCVTLSKKIITVSNFSKNEILKYTIANKKKIDVIYNGLSPNISNKLIEKKNNIEKYFLFVGNVKPHKNLKRLIAAYKLFLESNKEYKLYIIGQKDGFLSGEHNIEEEIKGYQEYIIFTGFLDDNILNSYYINASLFIFPSTYEGFGYPILEAMSFNSKIIASNRASIPEVGAQLIRYFNPLDVEDIEKSMKKALLEKTRNYENQIDKFSIEKMSINYKNFFEGMKSDITS